MTKNEEKSGPFGGPTCKHVKLDGTPCAQPARRGKEFCRFHQIMYEPAFVPGHPETLEPEQGDVEPDENSEPGEQEG